MQVTVRKELKKHLAKALQQAESTADERAHFRMAESEKKMMLIADERAHQEAAETEKELEQLVENRIARMAISAPPVPSASKAPERINSGNLHADTLPAVIGPAIEIGELATDVVAAANVPRQDQTPAAAPATPVPTVHAPTTTTLWSTATS